MASLALFAERLGFNGAARHLVADAEFWIVAAIVLVLCLLSSTGRRGRE